MNLPQDILRTLNFTLIHPHITYGIEVWYGSSDTIKNKSSATTEELSSCYKILALRTLVPPPVVAYPPLLPTMVAIVEVDISQLIEHYHDILNVLGGQCICSVVPPLVVAYLPLRTLVAIVEVDDVPPLVVAYQVHYCLPWWLS